MIENADMCLMYHQQALVNQLFYQSSAAKDKDFGALNNLIQDPVSNVTASMRFPGAINTNLRKLLINLQVYPRLHFFNVSHSRFNNRPGIDGKLPHPEECKETIKRLFDARNNLSGVDLRHKRLFSMATLFRGNFAPGEIEIATRDLISKNPGAFCNWIPNSNSPAYCNKPGAADEVSASCISNSGHIAHVLRPILGKFDVMFRKKAFLHWYTALGMDEFEFQEAQSNLKDLISEYDSYTSTRYDNEDEEEEDASRE